MGTIVNTSKVKMKVVLVTLIMTSLAVLVHCIPNWAFSDAASNVDADRINRYGLHPRYRGGNRNSQSSFQSAHAFANLFPTKREAKRTFGEVEQVFGGAEPSNFQAWLQKRDIR